MTVPFENDTGNIVRKLARKSLKSEKRRNLMVVIAVALASCLICFSIVMALSTRQIEKNHVEDTYEAVYTRITEEDVSTLKGLDDFSRVGEYYMLAVEPAEQGYNASYIYCDEETMYIARDQMKLLEGRLPQKEDEVVVSRYFLSNYGADAGIGEARAVIQEEMPLVVCCDLDLPDGSGMDFLDEVRITDKKLPFILASCHDKDDYEQEAMRRGATLCMDKMKGPLLQDKLVEYAYRQLSGEKAPTFHKLLFVHAEDTSAGVLRAAMLQKGFDLILVSSIGEAKRRIFEDKEIELILCDLELPDGTAMELFHTLRRVAGMFQVKNPPVRLLPFFILTENNDLAMEYEYRHEGVNDYITAPVNIPELIRRVLFFVE